MKSPLKSIRSDGYPKSDNKQFWIDVVKFHKSRTQIAKRAERYLQRLEQALIKITNM